MKIQGYSDRGLIREKNEDSFGYTIKEDGSILALLCDGIGGNNAGEVASKNAIDIILNEFNKSSDLHNPETATEWIKSTIQYCNDRLYQIASTKKQYHGMGTTLVGAMIYKDMTLIINVGDSRVYGLFDKMVCLTKDHNLVEELLHTGQITEEEALHSNRKHILTNALGVYNKVKVDIGLVNNEYDCLLLCSDGLHGYVDEKVIEDVLKKNKTTNEKVELLIQASLIEGGYDNTTVILIEKGVE